MLPQLCEAAGLHFHEACNVLVKLLHVERGALSFLTNTLLQSFALIQMAEDQPVLFLAVPPQGE